MQEFNNHDYFPTAQNPEKENLLVEIRDALQKMKYKSSVTGYDRTLMPHHIEANMGAIEPVIDRFFQDHLIQSKAKIWD